jgi:hypothetical protein
VLPNKVFVPKITAVICGKVEFRNSKIDQRLPRRGIEW